jgi:hypothetical protein
MSTKVLAAIAVISVTLLSAISCALPGSDGTARVGLRVALPPMGILTPTAGAKSIFAETASVKLTVSAPGLPDAVVIDDTLEGDAVGGYYFELEVATTAGEKTIDVRTYDNSPVPIELTHATLTMTLRAGDNAPTTLRPIPSSLETMTADASGFSPAYQRTVAAALIVPFSSRFRIGNGDSQCLVEVLALDGTRIARGTAYVDVDLTASGASPGYYVTAYSLFPGTPLSVSALARPSAPAFSTGSGSYPSPVNLTISGAGTIYFTDDGSDPAASPTRQAYTAAIDIASYAHIRAVCESVDRPRSAETKASICVPGFTPTINTMMSSLSSVAVNYHAPVTVSAPFAAVDIPDPESPLTVTSASVAEGTVTYSLSGKLLDGPFSLEFNGVRDAYGESLDAASISYTGVRTIHVSKKIGSNDANVGSAQYPKATLQAALAAVVPPATIRISASVAPYYELSGQSAAISLVIPSGVAIEGGFNEDFSAVTATDPDQTPIADARASGASTMTFIVLAGTAKLKMIAVTGGLVSGADSIAVAMSGAGTIDTCNIYGGGSLSSAYTAAVKVERTDTPFSGTASIKDSKIEGGISQIGGAGTSVGVDMATSGKVELLRNSIYGTPGGASGSVSAGHSRAVRATYSASYPTPTGVTIASNILFGGVCSSGSNYGILVEGAPSSTIAHKIYGNTIHAGTGSPGYCIKFGAGHSGAIKGNLLFAISNPQAGGVYFNPVARPSILSWNYYSQLQSHLVAWGESGGQYIDAYADLNRNDLILATSECVGNVGGLNFVQSSDFIGYASMAWSPNAGASWVSGCDVSLTTDPDTQLDRYGTSRQGHGTVSFGAAQYVP